VLARFLKPRALFAHYHRRLVSMRTKVVALLAVLTVGSTLVPSVAEACREHCRIRRGGIRIAGPAFGVRVAFPSAHMVIRGPILGFGGVLAEVPPPPPPPPAPEPPPPPEPPAYYTPMPETRIVHVAEPREPNIGVGIRGSAIRIGRDGPEANGIGALLRFRTRPVEFELEIGRDAYNEGMAREDTRLGASLYLPLVSSRFAPFLVAGVGMNFASFDVSGDELHQGYISGGGGLNWRLGSRLSIGADARYMLRRFFDSEEAVAANDVFRTKDDPSGLRDQAVEVRLNALLYF